MPAPVVAEKYVLLRQLGKGGMAEVFLAKQTGLRGFEKLVVVKRILPDRAMDGDFVTMFLDEARTAADLRHPNVINVLDINRADGTYYMTMEFLHGHDLRQLLKKANEGRQWIPIAQTVEIALGVAAGLHHAHTKTSIEGVPLNIVHRDVSPPNILVGFNGEVKLVDFGIAKAVTQTQHTEAGALKGKYAYMSPEQAEGLPLDHRSDQFALGILMWELLTQRRLFKRDSGPKTLMAVLEDDAPNVRDFRPDVPRSLADAVARALRKEPTQRFASCDGLRVGVEEAAAEEGIAHSAGRLAKYLKEVWGDPEDEAALSEQRIDEGDVAELDEKFREELLQQSGRAPRPRRKPSRPAEGTEERAKKLVSESRSETKRETPHTHVETVVGRSKKGPPEKGPPEKGLSEKGPSERLRADEADDHTLIVPGGGLEPETQVRPPPVVAPKRPSTTERPPEQQGVGSGPGHEGGPRRRGVVVGLAVAGGALLLGAGIGIGLVVAGPKEGSVIVRTEPKGARVLIDDVDTAEVTPHLLRPRVGSVVKVRVEKDGYVPATSVVHVDGPGPHEVHLVLEPTPP